METLKELLDKYRLSTEKHNEIYKIIENEVFMDIKPSKNPLAIIVGTQSGAGKGGLIQFSRDEVERRGESIKIITTDDYKPYHPNATEIAQKYPTQYVQIVESDAGRWTGEILQKAINEKYNFIFECTLKNNRILERMKELKENGFTVILRSLAVPGIESLISIFERYECQMKTLGFGRLVTNEYHDLSYDGMRDVIEEIEKSDLCDNIEIYVRGKKIAEPKIVYSTDKNLNIDYNAKIALDKYRKQEEDKMKDETVKKRIQLLRESCLERNANKDEMNQLDNLEKTYNKIYKSKGFSH